MTHRRYLQQGFYDYVKPHHSACIVCGAEFHWPDRHPLTLPEIQFCGAECRAVADVEGALRDVPPTGKDANLNTERMGPNADFPRCVGCRKHHDRTVNNGAAFARFCTRECQEAWRIEKDALQVERALMDGDG